VIQRATERALAGGMTLAKTLDLVEELRGRAAAPIVLFTYANPIYRFGLDAFAARARAGRRRRRAGARPAGRGGRAAARPAGRGGIDMIFLVSPTTTDERLRRPASGSGFLYGVSRLGVTGIAPTSRPAPRRWRHHAEGKPAAVALGFGLSRPEHIRDVVRFARCRGRRSALVDVNRARR
jgi:tryptophan synthase alpha chain